MFVLSLGRGAPYVGASFWVNYFGETMKAIEMNEGVYFFNGPSNRLAQVVTEQFVRC